MASYIDNKLLALLKSKKILRDEALVTSLAEAEKTGQPLAAVLVRSGLVEEGRMQEILSQEFRLSRTDLKKVAISKDAVDKVPLRFASHYKFMPLKIENNILTIAVAYPLEIKIQDEIGSQLGFAIETVLAFESDVLDLLKTHYGLAAGTIHKIISRGASAQEKNAENSDKKIEDIEQLAGEESVSNLVNQIIVEAYKKRASDIHIEPYRGGVRVRYRIDGVLYNEPVPPEIRHFYSSILSRFKIMSNLDIVERRLPQDGRAAVKVQDQVLDLRISSIPTPHEESLVIRILPTKMLFSLEKLGLSEKDRDIFSGLIKRPHGIIFVTGPTGSGKTTTLYTCLSIINTEERKIVTIEDPIEYELKGVTQMQVQPDIGLDFARGLRSVLRHDPDVVMVGEVRDFETAEIAIRTALTGHLVFSTLHTNDAASGIVRLMDVGIGAYLIASSVQAFVAQRLVRMICPECKTEDTTQPDAIRMQIAKELNLGSWQHLKFYKGKGCKACNATGFWGRSAVYEILLIDEFIKELIFRKASAAEIKKAAIRRGMHTLRLDGWRKVLEGVTTPEEVMELTQMAEQEDLEQDENPDDTGPALQESGPETDVPVSEPAADGQGSFPEKRVYQRLQTRINVIYRLFKTRGKFLKTRDRYEKLAATENISAGGVLFVSDDPIEAGSIVELKIELPDTGVPIECLAKIISFQAASDDDRTFFKIAACFLDLSGAERSRLDKYVVEELAKNKE